MKTLLTCLCLLAIGTAAISQDDCPGWEMNILGWADVSTCDNPKIHVYFELTGSDGDDDLFHVYGGWEGDQSWGENLVPPGNYTASIDAVPGGEGNAWVSAAPQVAPVCQEIETIYIGEIGGYGPDSPPHFVGLIGTDPASCAGGTDGVASFYSEAGVLLEDLNWTIEPEPESYTSGIFGSQMIVQGLPAGDYCMSFETEEEPCGSDDHCFTIVPGDVIDPPSTSIPLGSMPLCDYQNSVIVDLNFAPGAAALESYDAVVTDQESLEAIPTEVVEVNSAEGLLSLQGLYPGRSYCIDLSGTGLCDITVCLDVESTDEPYPELIFEIIEPVSEPGGDALVYIDAEGVIDTYLLLGPIYSELPTTVLLSEGVHLFDIEGSACIYALYAEVPEFAAIPGCTDALACNYTPEATSDNGTCQYLEGCGDLDGDGITSTSDLLLLLGGWGSAGDDLIGDLNGDGVIGAFDLLTLLGYL